MSRTPLSGGPRPASSTSSPRARGPRAWPRGVWTRETDGGVSLSALGRVGWGLAGGALRGAAAPAAGAAACAPAYTDREPGSTPVRVPGCSTAYRFTRDPPYPTPIAIRRGLNSLNRCCRAGC
eukprot:1670314-Prymnesium_polylepis.1